MDQRPIIKLNNDGAFMDCSNGSIVASDSFQMAMEESCHSVAFCKRAIYYVD